MTSGGQSSKDIVNILKGNMQSVKEFGMNPYKVLRFFLHKLFTKSKHFASMKLNSKKRNQFQIKINTYLNSIK